MPILQIRHRSIVQYYEPLNMRSARNNLKTWRAKDLYKQAYSGRVTLGVRKRLTKAMNIMLQTTSGRWIENPVTGYTQYHRLGFCTLKIPGAQVITGRRAYDELFNHFLDWLTRTCDVKVFVWKLEPQLNGQPHYHVTFPDFIPVADIRECWNSLLRKAGLLEDYAEKHGHYRPNSVDIHEVTSVDDLASYMVKAFTDSIDRAEKSRKKKPEKTEGGIAAEMAKAEQGPVEINMEGAKIWGCSELLSWARYPTFIMYLRHERMLENMEQSRQVRVVSDPNGYWSIIYFSDASPPDVLGQSERAFMAEFLKWQLSRPAKARGQEALSTWEKQAPSLSPS